MCSSNSSIECKPTPKRKCENIYCFCIKSCDFHEEYSEKKSQKSEEKLSLWECILKESEEKKAALYEWMKNNVKQDESDKHDENCPINYLEEKIFPVLLPAMEQMLIEAHRSGASLQNRKCRFNGLDYLAEYLWNKNPTYPERSSNWLQVFDIPTFRLWLQEHPRTVYPKSWIWSEEEAALHIQRHIRGWLVRKRPEVQELRQFWKALANEKENPDILIDVNDKTMVNLITNKQKNNH